MEHTDKQHEQLAQAARLIQERRTGLVLTGRIVNGKLELDKTTLDDIRTKFGNANTSFVAVNAPFDPTAV
jgi:hypothetical protein